MVLLIHFSYRDPRKLIENSIISISTTKAIYLSKGRSKTYTQAARASKLEKKFKRIDFKGNKIQEDVSKSQTNIGCVRKESVPGKVDTSSWTIVKASENILHRYQEFRNKKMGQTTAKCVKTKFPNGTRMIIRISETLAKVDITALRDDIDKYFD